MTDVKIPIYDGLSYLPIYLAGTENNNQDVEVTALNLGNESLKIPVKQTILGDFLEPRNSNNVRKLKLSDKKLDRTFEFPARNIQLDKLRLAISWKSLRIHVKIPGGNASPEIRLEIFHMRISSPLLPSIALEGNLGLLFDLNGLQVEKSYFKRYDPDVNHLVPLDFKGFTSNNKFFNLQWKEPNINYWLRRLSPNLVDTSVPVDSDVSLRIVFGNPVKEIRLDWQVLGSAKTFTLPGLKLTTPELKTPDKEFFTLLIQADENQSLNNLALILTLDTGRKITASSDFAWERDGDRELQGDAQEKDDKSKKDEPFLKLDVTTKKSLSLVLLHFKLNEFKLPRFFRQLKTPLTPIKGLSVELLEKQTVDNFNDENFVSLDESWEIDFSFNKDAIELPFLKRKKEDEQSQQSIKCQKPKEIDTDVDVQPSLDLPTSSVIVFIDTEIIIGTLTFNTQFSVYFNWEIFAFKLKHENGIKLLSKDETLPEQNFLGLTWRFIGKEITAQETNQDANNKEKRYHHFTLVTQKYNYQIVQAEGSVVEIDYTRASNEPITFAISDFALTGKGINLTATVTDKPARLNGIDTRFRFHGSRLEIKENRIRDFTLSGSGPLPPALVGDATADISLQFSQRDGSLTLVAGSANLKGEKLLDCKGTRFQFAIDAMGLKFVNDGKFHLYFTLTGSAQFVPAASDDKNGPLALLKKAKIDLVECPLTGDASVISKHIKFLIELPQAKSFNFLGCFEMEIRAIGFVPQFDKFDNDGAMQITGQLKFAQGAGDSPNSEPNYHTLFIGLPKKGSFIPRIYFQNLPVNLNIGSAFKLNGTVSFIDEANEKGFSGEGVLEIQGLPTLAASFAFLRVRRDEASPWVRAWFIYLEVRQVTFQIPVVEMYLREVGLGFGYRYTIASIKAADEAGSLKELIGSLRELSRTQGDLSKRDRWAIDLEAPGEDPRWTIVLRAMISQTAASPSPLRWNEEGEKALPACLYLFDAVIAFRSDLTFFMAVRGWLNTAYYDYVKNVDNLRERPLLSGFVLLSVRQKRFLAQVSSNPNGSLGIRPRLPSFIESAVTKGQFSATLLIEPGLVHAELGWPNMLRWKDKIGPLEADIRGGFIFRVSKQNLVIGISFLARASLKFEAGLDFKLIGVRVSAYASVAYGARYIGLVDFKDPMGKSAIYGGIGLEIRIKVAIEVWIKIPLLIKTITKTFRLSLEIGFTAGIEFGLDGISPSGAGLRGTGTISLSVMGRRLQLSVKLGVNESAVDKARKRTEPFLNVGLEATEVEGLPGVNSAKLTAQRSATPTTVIASTGVFLSEAASAVGVFPLSEGSTVLTGTFKAPNYDVFVIRQPKDKEDKEWSYFVLLPQGEVVDEEGNSHQENGFLPAPPQGITGTNDFRLNIPASANFTLEQFDPIAEDWKSRPTGQAMEWNVDWEAEIEQATAYGEDGKQKDTSKVLLKEYLGYAFKSNPNKEGELLGDPDPIGDTDKPTEDGRVHNPSEDAFEAAVRGAVEQFRGSPFFKRDLNSDYEQILEAAFQDDTTIYTGTGQVNEATQQENNINQQAHQMRGLIVQDLIADVRDYAAAPSPDKVKPSIAFQMGLVFRFKGAAPKWLDEVISDQQQIPTISQRIGQNFAEVRQVRTFNIKQTSFRENPPQFQRVQQFTDANTIAITWDLAWERSPIPNQKSAQAQPEHHLMHYQVRRRALDGSERELVYTVKSAQVLHRENGALKSLKPRFQVVDHFTQETLEDQAALPATGRSYLYTITPVDFAGNVGRALTLVATRYPNEPPRVPVDGQLRVNYRLTPQDLTPDEETATGRPSLVIPQSIEVKWKEPGALQEGPRVAIAKYRLIFRKESTLPIGSYGLDSSTQGSRTKSLPTTNARPLPTDIKIDLTPEGPQHDRSATITVRTLQDAGVFPDEDALKWRSESWRIYFQTVSTNEVPSALAPVQVLLHVESTSGKGNEERQPAEFEWLPKPSKFPMLPPEDQRAIAGETHFPMPVINGSKQAPKFTGDMSAISYQPHPAGIRFIRFRWNQGASNQPNYPLDLNAGYHLLQLDIDAHTDETFDDPAKLANALKTIQEVQMLPADDLLVTPGDTLTTNQWEAWYPSTMLRRKPPEERAEGSQIALTPWYSWRESILEWPAWSGLTPNLDDKEPRVGERSKALHPFLQAIIEALDEKYNIDLQVSPPMQPGNFAAFMKLTAPKSDPYGWGILQRLGLSVALSLRKDKTNDIITDQELLDALKQVIDAHKSKPEFAEYTKHLHVELLFQAGRSVESEPKEQVDATSLLAIAQLSLRPITRQILKYAKLKITGPAGAKVNLALKLSKPCSLIDQANPAKGQIELQPDAQLTKQTIQLPLNGSATLLLRSETEQIDIRIALKAALDRSKLPPNFSEYFQYDEQLVPQLIIKKSLQKLPQEQQTQFRDAFKSALTIDDQPIADSTFESLERFLPTDELSTYFTVPESLAVDFSNTSISGGQQWFRFKCYLESLSSNDPTISNDLKITIPTNIEGKEGIQAILPDFLTWSQRFLDFGGELSDELTGDGPWLATAYPRSNSPAYATPDASGRLKYDHLLEDKWAHNYRYYIRPYSRYELLWRSLLQSPALFPPKEKTVDVLANFIITDESLTNLKSKVPDEVLQALAKLKNQVFVGRKKFLDRLQTTIGKEAADKFESLITEFAEKFLDAVPDPQAGGLDIVLDRTQPVDKPLILSSSRLDDASTPDKPAVPGSTWEVIIAQHQEQTLIERNQTLARQLAFRQIAFTLLRRFAYPEWIEQLEKASKQTEIKLKFVENQLPALPAAYPTKPEHIDLSKAKLDDAIVRSLDLPERIGNFQQGALVVQWEALPYYYEHRLLLVAQTASTVSPINETIQRDFEYQAPNPIAIIEPIQKDWQPVSPFVGDKLSLRTRQVDIPLQRFWDCLSEAAQEQWISEAPDPKDGTANERKLASIPDPEVVYQIVEFFSGNIEVQAEFYFDRATGNYQVRQLGRRYLAELIELKSPATPQADYILNTTLQQITEEQLKRTYDKNQIPGNTNRKIAFTDKLLSVVSVFTRQDRNNILLNSVEELRKLPQNPGNDLSKADDFLREWYTTRAFSTSPALDNLPADLRAKLDYPELPSGVDLPVVLENQLRVNTIGLVWRGAISAEQRTALKEYEPNLPIYQAAVRQLLDSMSASNIVFLEAYNVPPRPRPDSSLPGSFKIEVNYPPNPSANWVLQWTGVMNNVEEAALRSLPGDSDFKDGISRLIAQIKEQPFSLTIASGTGDFPTNSNFTQGNFQIEVKSGGRELKWKGILTANEEAQLRNLSGDTAFTTGVEQLITQIKSHLFAETISFAWPRVDKLKLQAQIKHELVGLELPPPNDNGSIQWKGVTNLGLSSGYLIARVKASLHNGDPFVQAFENLLKQIAAQEFSVAFTLPRLLRCKEPLTELEKEALKTLFSSQSEQLNRLFDDLDDKQTLERLYQDWFSQEPISKIASLPSELENLVDFPEPTECTLVWEGEMSPEAKAALLALPGDDGFKQALTRLTSIRPQPSELPDSIRNQLQIGTTQLTWRGEATNEQRQALSRLNGDESFLSAIRNLVKAVEKATNNSVTTVFLGDVIKVTAPLGLDQIPGSLANKIKFPEQSSGNYTKLRWTDALFDEDAITLKRWAQIPQFLEAVNSLLQTLDKREIPISLPEELPSAIANNLQITPNSLAWLGTVPNAEQRTALQSLSNDTRRQPELRDAVERLLQAIDTDAGSNPVVIVTASDIKLRPQQDDLPVILKPQLTLTPTQVTWKGRLGSVQQLKALQNLMGDAPLKEAIASIISTLTAATEINFKLPVRPQLQDLPERLRDKLLIGRAVIRYHGLMTVAEGHQLQALFTTQTDKDAIARLYDASSNKGLRGRELKIRARRGSAAPSEMNAFTPKQL
jgi:hypothetical protein